MTANMMEMLRQMQQDQKESIKYLHDKFSFVERKIIELDKKIDQQQVPMKRLEEQVRKNNTLLFGNHETETNIEDSNVFHSDNDKTPLAPSTKIIDNIQPKKYSQRKVEDSQFHLNDNFKILVDTDAERKASIENTAGISLKKQDIEVFSVKLFADQINQLDEKLDKITDMYQSDMSKMKNIIKSFEAVATGFSQDQNNHLNLVLARLTEMNQKELSGMKELMKDYAEKIKQEIITQLKKTAKTNQSELKAMKKIINDLRSKNRPTEEAASPDIEPVKISPTYFSEDQISKLNCELKRIAELYQASNKFPIIEIIPGKADNHPVMSKLRKGIYFMRRDDEDMLTCIKLGLEHLEGFTSSYAINLLSENPDLSSYDVVMNWLEFSDKLDELTAEYDIYKPMIYNSRGDLVDLGYK